MSTTDRSPQIPPPNPQDESQEEDDSDEDYVPSDASDDDDSEGSDDGGEEVAEEDDDDDDEPQKRGAKRGGAGVKRKTRSKEVEPVKRTRTTRASVAAGIVTRRQTRSSAAASPLKKDIVTRQSTSKGAVKPVKAEKPNQEKTESETPVMTEEEARKKRLDDIWKSMNAPKAQKPKPKEPIQAPRTERVLRTYKYAGEEFSVTETVKMPATSTTAPTPDPIPSNPAPSSTTTDPINPPEDLPADPSTPPEKDQHPAEEGTPSSSTSSSSSSSSIGKKVTQRKSVLQDIATRYGVGKEAAKLNTLDKSKLDWMRHVEATGDGDRLRRHNKDGHLEKMDFLNRTYERQSETVKMMKKVNEKKSGSI
ncbi:hypothetical protein HDU67_006819 [Dinochytrium kinnereticum]|nr:hypothetical protein HDU67_006819 [Dinochytrium kinnereticum]